MPRPPKLLALLALTLLATPPAHAGNFTLIPLGAPTGATSIATALNAAGTVVGYDVNTSSGTAESFFFKSPTYTPKTYGTDDTRFVAINATGTAAGNAQTSTGASIPLTFNIHTGQFSTITLAPNLSATLAGINASGTVVGYVFTPGTNTAPRGLLAQGKKTTYLVAPGAVVSTIANAINDAGTVVGTFQKTATPTLAFSYMAGKFTSFAAPKATATTPLGITASGTIFGWYSDAKFNIHGFTKTGTSFKTLDYPGGSATLVLALSSSGQAFGTYADATGATHSFVYTAGKFTTLSVPGAQQTTLTNASTSGAITGYWRDANFINHAFFAQCTAKQAPCTTIPAP